jgi:ribonuclease P protein component
MRLARLTQRKEFLAAAEHGRRFRSSALSVQVLDRPVGDDADDTGLRLGLTASRKVGNAVKRNRIRRRLRAAAALALADKAGQPSDLVIVARPETLSASFPTLVAEVALAFARAKPARSGRRPATRDRDAGPAAARQPS